jgi:hypothetical protein
VKIGKTGKDLPEANWGLKMPIGSVSRGTFQEGPAEKQESRLFEGTL